MNLNKIAKANIHVMLGALEMWVGGYPIALSNKT